MKLKKNGILSLNSVLIFVAGAVVGSLATYKFVKTATEQLIQDEVRSMKEYYAKRYPRHSGPVPFHELNVEERAKEENEEQLPDNNDVRAYAAKLSKEGYTNYSGIKPKEVEDVAKPYVIEPCEFGMMDDYETIELVYFADGVLTDDFEEPIEDVEGTVGKDFYKSIGLYEDDAVHIRNDEFGTDYIILADNRNYSDIANKNPHQTEG